MRSSCGPARSAFASRWDTRVRRRAFGTGRHRQARRDGSACGLAGGLYASRYVETMLFDVATRDAWSLALPFGILLLAAVAAAAIPAWRASRVDPVIALRDGTPADGAHAAIQRPPL